MAAARVRCSAASHSGSTAAARVQDTSVCGLSTYAMRAMLEDHACGRLAFYDRLAQHAHRQDWPGFALMVLEYISMSGYDASALFKIPNGQPPQ